MLICPLAWAQALACIWMILCLLNIAVRSELARDRGRHLLSIAIQVRSEMARGTGGRTSLIRSQEARGCTANLCTVHGRSNRYGRRYMNVLIRGVVDRGMKLHGKNMSITKSLRSNRNTPS